MDSDALLRSLAKKGRAVLIGEKEESILRVTNLKKSFDDAELIKGISFQLKQGGRLAILGPGGCGKSTLLKLLLGIVPSDGGSIELMGKDIAKISKKERLSLLSKAGMAFQQGALFDFMTVRENILFAMENMTSFSRTEMEDRVASLLASVYLPSAGHKLPSELSGGMRRRVGIVRAMSTDPLLALLDEPTAGLDPVTSTVVINMIHRLGEHINSALLCVTSSVEVAFTFSEEVAVMKDGLLIGQGNWEDLHKLGDPWITNFLDTREFIPLSRRMQTQQPEQSNQQDGV